MFDKPTKRTANRIFVEEILPLVTAAISAITAELNKPIRYKKEDLMDIYTITGDKMKSDFCSYVDATIEAQCNILLRK